MANTTPRTQLPLITVFLFSLVVSGCAQKIDTAAEFLEVAYRHERNGELPEAVSAYRKAIELDPKLSTAWYDLGVAYSAMEQFSEAIDSYTKAIELDSGMARAYNNRAAAYARLKQYQRAIADCDIAVSLDVNDALAWRNRGLAYHDNDQLDEALTNYDESIRINGRLAETYHYRGNVFLDREQWTRAIEDFDQALHLDSQMSAAHLSRAIGLARLGKREEAEASRNQASELGADVADVDLDALDPAVAPVAAKVDLRHQAVNFVQEVLKKTDPATTTSQQPWDLQQGDEGSRCVVRVLTGQQTGSDVTFTTAELKQIAESQDRPTTLIVVRAGTEEQDGAPIVTFTIAQRIENWVPDFKVMQPVTWSMPVVAEDFEATTANSSVGVVSKQP